MPDFRNSSPTVMLVCASLILTLALGIRHGFGLFLQPMSMDNGWGREVFGFAVALQNLLWGITQPFTGMLADRFGARLVLRADRLVAARGRGGAGFIRCGRQGLPRYASRRRGRVAQGSARGGFSPQRLLAARRGVLRLRLPGRLHRHALPRIPDGPGTERPRRHYLLVADRLVQYFRILPRRTTRQPFLEDLPAFRPLRRARVRNRPAARLSPHADVGLPLRRSDGLPLARHRAAHQRRRRRNFRREAPRHAVGLRVLLPPARQLLRRLARRLPLRSHRLVPARAGDRGQAVRGFRGPESAA